MMVSLFLLLLSVTLMIAKLWSKPSCPASIEKVIWNSGQGEHDEVDKAYRTLTRCATAQHPVVRTLRLSIQQAGCVVSHKDARNFDFRPGDRFPSLHQLHLKGYSFNDAPKSGLQWNFQDEIYHFWRWLAYFSGLELFRPIPEISGWDGRGANLERWKAAMNWTELRDLSLDEVDAVFLKSMQGQLPALESLNLGWLRSENCLGDNVTDFVTRLNSLRQLSLRGHTRKLDLPQILDRHGDSIETLEIHEWEGSHFLRPTLSRSELEQISHKCPSLTKLGLDINRNGTWPHELLDLLSANRNLSTLEISFELGMNLHRDANYYSGINKTKDFRQPVVDLLSSLTLFNRLRSLKQGVELQTMRFFVGDAGREYGHMMRSWSWGETLAEVYECTTVDSKGRRKTEGEAWCEQSLRAGVDYGLYDFEEEFDVENEGRLLEAEQEL